MALNCTAQTFNGTQYSSSSIEATSSLNGLRYLTDLIINSVFFTHNTLPRDIAATFDFFNCAPFIYVIRENWRDMLRHNPSLLTMVTFGVAVAVILAVSGLINASIYCGSKNADTVWRHNKDNVYLMLEGLAYFILFTIIPNTI